VKNNISFIYHQTPSQVSGFWRRKYIFRVEDFLFFYEASLTSSLKRDTWMSLSWLHFSWIAWRFVSPNKRTRFTGVGRIFSRWATRRYFLGDFTHSKLRKQLFLLKTSKSLDPPLRRPWLGRPRPPPARPSRRCTGVTECIEILGDLEHHTL